MSYYTDHVKPLAILFFRYTGKKLSRGLRWAMRSRGHFALSLIVALVALIGIHMGATSLKDDHHPVAPAAGQSDDKDHLNYRDAPAKPVGADDHKTSAPSSSASSPAKASGQPSLGAGPQAVHQQGPSPSYEPRKVASPSRPKVDRKSPDSTAQAFATAYLSREDGKNQWQDWTAELTNKELAEQLKNAKTPLQGRGDSSVTDVKVSKAPYQGADKDTPVRWSRTLDVTVATSQGSTVQISYKATLMRGENGWEVTDAVEDGSTVKASEKGK